MIGFTGEWSEKRSVIFEIESGRLLWGGMYKEVKNFWVFI